MRVVIAFPLAASALVWVLLVLAAVYTPVSSR